jgi:integrase
VFQSRKGHNRPISRVQAWRMLEALYEANGLTGRLGTHSMRKAFVNKVYTVLKGDLVKTQRALGHRNINSAVH